MGPEPAANNPSYLRKMKNHDMREVNFFASYLNDEQKNAVRNICNLKCSCEKCPIPDSIALPYILHGPPGTGKTSTLIEAIRQLVETDTNKILVVAHSNTACDNITEKVFRHFTSEKLIRLNASYRKQIPPSITEICKAIKQIDSESLPQIFVSTIGSVKHMHFKKKFTHLFCDEASQITDPEMCIALRWRIENSMNSVFRIENC